MIIEISPKEYRELLDILHISDVVMSGHRKENIMRSREHRALIQKLYALAGREGLDQLIGYNEHEHTYVPTAEFEENSMAHDVIDEFGDHLFWDQLIARLSARDAAQMAGGIAHLNEMSDSERQAAEEPIRQRYVQEFAANGVANLEVVERFAVGGGAQVRTSD